MIVIEKLSTEFEIQFVVKLIDSLTNVRRLHLQVFFIIKPNFHKVPSFLSIILLS